MPASRTHQCQAHDLSVPQAFIVALLIEGLLTVAALRYAGQHHALPVPRPVPFTVTLAPLSPIATPKPKPAPPPVKPHPKPVPVPVPKKPVVKPKPAPQHPVVRHRRTTHHVKPQPKPRPVAHKVHPRPAPPPKAPARTPPARQAPPVSVARPSPKALARITATFKDAVRSAVRTAVRYPRVARVMGIEGAAEVAFKYRDGSASHVHVVHSSGSPILDQAALNAVRQSSLPPPPTALRGHMLRFRIWLRFHFNGSD